MTKPLTNAEVVAEVDRYALPGPIPVKFHVLLAEDCDGYWIQATMVLRAAALTSGRSVSHVGILEYPTTAEAIRWTISDLARRSYERVMNEWLTADGVKLVDPSKAVADA